jgi:hypothetical protein
MLGVSGIVPILMDTDVCHQATFPAIHLLLPYSQEMSDVTGEGAHAEAWYEGLYVWDSA